MIFQEIYNDILNSFSSLWTFKERGNTLEIITPYTTTNHKFVSIFLSKQNNDYIVSDGGLIQSFGYDTPFLGDDDIFNRILEHYISVYDIKQINAKDTVYYFKRTNNPIHIPALIFDISTFFSSIISTCNIELSDKKEKDNRNLFSKSANDYISSITEKSKVKINGFVDEEKTLKVSSIYKLSGSSFIPVNYVTGSNINTFSNSLYKTNTIFEMIEKSKYSRYYNQKIAFINNISEGFIPEKVNHILLHMKENTKTKILNWTERAYLKNILN